MWLFVRMIEKFQHYGTAYLGCWLYLYLVTLESRLWHHEHCFGCAYLSLCPGQSEAGTPGSRQTTDRPSHVHYERFFTCLQVLRILRILPHLEKNSFGNCLSCCWMFTKWKILSWFLKIYYFICILYKYVIFQMCVLVHMLNLEKEFLGSGETM